MSGANSLKSRLLDLPDEVLLNVLYWVCVKFDGVNEYDEPTEGHVDSYVVRHATPHYAIGGWHDVSHNDRRMPRYQELYSKGNLGLEIGALSVLQTCHRLSILSRIVLYGGHHFTIYPAESLRVKFARLIGLVNLGLIRCLTIGLPHAIKTMPSKYLPKYLDLLTSMANLRSFTITTGTGGPACTNDPHDAVTERDRGLLWFAAWITLRHLQKYNNRNDISSGRYLYCRSAGSAETTTY